MNSQPIQAVAVSRIGGRKTNDDTADAFGYENHFYAYVGDGLGAYSGGKQASQAAREVMYRASMQGGLTADKPMLLSASEADQAVKQLQKETGGSMKTTLVFLAIENCEARWMHVGDSRLYHFRNGHIVSQTRDHSVSQMAVLMGDIAPEDIRFHPDRNRILRALGAECSNPELSPPVTIKPGEDAFLLCTDGFWEFVLEEEMERLLAGSKTPKEWLKKMLNVHKERTPDDTDNYSAVAVFCWK